MPVNKWVIAVIAVSVGSPFAVGVLGMFGIGPGFHVEAPEWEAGYEWRYDSTMSAVSAVSGMGEEESERLEFAAETHRVVGNTTLVLDGVPVYAVAEQFVPKTVRVDGQLLFDAKRDGAAASGEFSNIGCAFFCGEEYSFYTRSDLNPFFPGYGEWESSELRLLDFPLTRKSWIVMSERDDSGMGMDEAFFEIEARAVGTDLVRLGALGAMEAIRIEAGMTPASKDSIKRMLGADLAEGTVPGLNMALDVDVSITYWYAPQAMQIVRADTLVLFDMRMSYEGESMHAREEMRASDTLKAYSLEAGPERSLRELDQINRVNDELQEVRELSNQSWPFTIAASTFSADATKGESVRLGLLKGSEGGDVIADAFDEIPAGMRAEWTHRYLQVRPSSGGSADGGMDAALDRYSGATLEIPINAQGLHEVTVQLLDREGRLVGVDSIILEGYGEWPYDSNLPVGALGFTGRHEVHFHTNMFLDVVEIRIDPGELGMGSAEWHGPAGEDRFSVFGPVTEKVHADPLTWGDWVLRYDDALRVDPLSLSVIARYDRTMDPTPFLKPMDSGAGGSGSGSGSGGSGGGGGSGGFAMDPFPATGAGCVQGQGPCSGAQLQAAFLEWAHEAVPRLH